MSSGRPCSHLNIQPCCDIEQDRGQQPAENVDLAFFCDVISIAPQAHPDLPTAEEKFGNEGPCTP